MSPLRCGDFERNNLIGLSVVSVTCNSEIKSNNEIAVLGVKILRKMEKVQKNQTN
jgi:hypothetical protein